MAALLLFVLAFAPGAAPAPAAQDSKPDFEGDLKRLEADFAKADAAYYAPMRAAKTEEERKAVKLDPDARPYPLFQPRFRELADRAKGTEAGLDVLIAMIRKGNQERADANKKLGGLIDEALAGYASSPKLEKLVPAIDSMGYYIGKSKYHSSLEAIAEKSPHDNVKAAALAARAKTMFTGRGFAEGFEKGELESNRKLSYEIFEKIVAKFPNTPGAKAVQPFLYERDFLANGKPAPDFEAVDQDGKKFKLSDYRGKVVVLDFWGFW